MKTAAFISALATLLVAQTCAIVFPPAETAELIRNAVESSIVAPPDETYAVRADVDPDERTHATGW